MVKFDRHVGENDNWYRMELPSVYEELFQSNGRIASYPKQKIRLGVIEFSAFPDDAFSTQEFKIPYKIFTDKGVSGIGELIIIHKWEDY